MQVLKILRRVFFKKYFKYYASNLILSTSENLGNAEKY